MEILTRLDAVADDVQKFLQDSDTRRSMLFSLILGDVDTDEGIEIAERYFAGYSPPQPVSRTLMSCPLEERRGFCGEKLARRRALLSTTQRG